MKAALVFPFELSRIVDCYLSAESHRYEAVNELYRAVYTFFECFDFDWELLFDASSFTSCSL